MAIIQVKGGAVLPRARNHNPEDSKMRFNKWIDTLLEEKGIDVEESLTVFKGGDKNAESRELTVGFIVEHIKVTGAETPAMVKNALVRIDFANGDVRDFLAHIGASLWDEADNYIAIV